MFLKSKGFQLGIAVLLGIIIFLLPRPEGTKFKVTGDTDKVLFNSLSQYFKITDEKEAEKSYILEAIKPGSPEASQAVIADKALELNLKKVDVDYVDGLSPKAKRFLAVLVVLVFMFVAEPIPLEITAICIGVALVAFQIADVKDAWAPYMHPVVVFIMCCLIFAISLDKAGLTKRLGFLS